MAYTAGKPPLAASSDELRARIPGWGVDLDPKDRPSVPRERLVDPRENGAHWDFPERQPETWPRERSVEHKFLTPVFGTACPPHGLSGAVRKFAYRYSEARTAHWLLLVLGDRVDAIEHHLRSFATLRPDNPVTQTGVLSEVRRHGLSSRVGRKRADVAHQTLDPVVVAGPWLVAGFAVYAGVRSVVRRRRG